MTGICEECGEVKSSTEKVFGSSGRDYGGVGGAPSPPERVSLCKKCRDMRERQTREQAKAESER